MINFNTMGELIAMAEEKQLPIHEIVIAREMHVSQRSREAILDGMKQNWTVMQASIERGIKNTEQYFAPVKLVGEVLVYIPDFGVILLRGEEIDILEYVRKSLRTVAGIVCLSVPVAIAVEKAELSLSVTGNE